MRETLAWGQEEGRDERHHLIMAEHIEAIEDWPKASPAHLTIRMVSGYTYHFHGPARLGIWPRLVALGLLNPAVIP